VSDTWSKDVDNVTTVNIVACTCRYDLPDRLERMLRYDWETRRNFQGEFRRKIICKCHYCHNHSTAWIHIFSILSTIIYSTCAVPISTFGGTRPIPTISQGDGETFRFNEPQEQPVRIYIPCLTCTFQLYN